MELLTPAIGLVFWTVLFFLIAWGILGKAAWKPIVSMLEARGKNIEEALKGAEAARKELQGVKQESAEILKQARIEREAILKKAKEEGEGIVSASKEKAADEASKIMVDAKANIDREKMLALASLKGEIASLSVSVAGKALGADFDEQKQKQAIDSAIKDLNLN